MRRTGALLSTAVLAAALVSAAPALTPTAAAQTGLVPAGGILRVEVPEAFGGKTVIGNLAVDRVAAAGFVTAFPCARGLPTDAQGRVTRADLNYDGRVSPVWSNRLIVEADGAGDICFYTLRPAALIVDVNAVTFDTGIGSFPNRRTDTRDTARPRLPAGEVLRVAVPEAVGGKTVVGQLAVDQLVAAGFVTAYPCDAGLPTGAGGVDRADLNVDGRISPVRSNRLIVEADADGDVCFYTSVDAALIVDVNGVADVGISSFPNRRTDTRPTATPLLQPGQELRVSVPEAAGRATVVGQVAVDRVDRGGYVTAYGCDDGPPLDDAGRIARADLNYDGRVTPVWSNRLVVQADADGDVCFRTFSAAALVVDLNGLSDVGIQSFPNRRTDTRVPGAPGGSGGPTFVDGVPVWPPYTPLPGVAGTAALTGLPAGPDVTSRPILAVKIDNFNRARPQWGLDRADAVIEVNAEGISRFVALFQTQLPAEVGPVRSARTGDLELLSAMNRPVFAYSGANAGVTAWINSAASSGLLVDFSALRRPCYARSPDRAGPHNLLLDPVCALDVAIDEGPARPLWSHGATWTPGPGVTATAIGSFTVPMDGVVTQWTWDAGSGRYLRSQDGQPHVAVDGTRIAAANVVVLTTTYVPSPVDARSPSAVTTGTGTGVVHRGGQAIPVEWSRPTPYDPFTFTDATTGQPVPLATGTTWVQLVR